MSNNSHHYSIVVVVAKCIEANVLAFSYLVIHRTTQNRT